MDLFEKVFERLWTPQWKKLRASPETLHFTEIKPYLESVHAFTMGARQILELNPSRFFVGANGTQLHLPEYIGFAPTRKLNRQIYLYLNLINGAIINLKLQSQIKGRSRVAQRLETLLVMPQINRYLDEQFSCFPELQKEVICLLGSSKESVLKEWPDFILQRTDLSLAQRLNLDRKLSQGMKANDFVPDFLFLSLPCLPSQATVFQIHSPEIENPLAAKLKSEIEKRVNEKVQKVNLEEEKKHANPVTHSFEKLETADDYQGGYRTDSGDDELSNHEKALEEVDLSQMTVDGETAQSLYKAEGQLQYQLAEKADLPLKSVELTYPEWSQGQSSYLKNHCKLFVRTESLNEGVVRGNLQADLQKKYRAQIEVWRKKLSQIAHEPLWLRRQKEGDEIDYDSMIRYMVDLKNKSNSDDRLYAKKRRQRPSLAVTLLFDQSLSTDSWVCDQRVLDVIINSLGLAGILFEDLISSISIAGTWSASRHHCEYIIYKTATDSWDHFFKMSSQIQAQGYTRLGPALRHATDVMKKSAESRKILVLLTDGKPTDIDHYEGEHGICDIKKACQEASLEGIYTYAMTVEREAKSHFPKMFQNYSILPHPDRFTEELIRTLMKVSA